MRLFVRTLTAAVVALAFGLGLILCLPAPAHAAQPAAKAKVARAATKAAPAKAVPKAVSTKAAAKKGAQLAGAINVNTASAAELTVLPGIGPAKAERIVAARKQAAFKRPEDLVRVKGIGPKTVQKLLPYLKVSGPSDLRRASLQ